MNKVIHKLKYVYFVLWKRRLALYLSVLNNEIAQVKSIFQVIVLFLGLLVLLGFRFTRTQTILVLIGLFIIAVLAGYALFKLKVPEENNKINNELNPEFKEILDYVRRHK